MEHSDSIYTSTRARAASHRLEQRSAEELPHLKTSIPAGLTGAATVAAMISLVDVASGQPLATPNVLGAISFRAMPFDLATPVGDTNVFSYTLMHAALFVIVAIAAITAEFSLSQRFVSLGSQFLMGAVTLFVALQVSILTMLLLNIPITSDFGAGRLPIINALAATATALIVFSHAAKRLEGDQDRA
jgi:hypothetical protein